MPGRRFVRLFLLVIGCVLPAGVWWVVASMHAVPSREELARISREARRELGSGRADSALAVLRPALRPEVHDGRIWEAAGGAYLSLRLGPEAVAAFDRISPESGLWATSRLGLARALLLQGNWDRALSVLDEATSRDPSDLPALEELRWLQFNLVRPQHAFQTLGRKLLAGDLSALPDLLETAHRRPIPQESLRILTEMDGKSPGQPVIKLALGRCRWHLGELTAARGLLFEALGLRPNDATSRVTVAEFLLEQVETGEAEKVLSALEGHAAASSDEPAFLPEAERYWALRSQILEQRGDIEGALTALEKGETSGISRVEWLARRASLLRVLRRTEEARDAAIEAREAGAAGRELGSLVDAGKHRNPGVADAKRIADACSVLKRDAESKGWQLIAARLASSPPNGGRR